MKKEFKEKRNFLRVNNQIVAPRIRLSLEDGSSIIVSNQEAKNRAYDLDLDLVEFVPNANPPVCKIIDFGKWKYEEKIKKKEDIKKNKSVSVKEIQLRYCIEQHDIETKVKSIKKFLEEKKQVRIVVKFRNREIAFASKGEQLLSDMIESIKEIGQVLSNPKFEGRNLVVNIAPKQ